MNIQALINSKVGWGFATNGEFDSKSCLRQLFKHGDNVKEYPERTTEQREWIFESREELSEKLEASSNIKGSHGAFSGEFEASFQSTAKTNYEHWFARYSFLNKSSTFSLENRTSDYLLDSVTSDEDFMNVPEVLTEENFHLFIRFFEKFGAYYVKDVVVGGRYTYNASIEKSKISKKEEFSAQVSAQYAGMFSASGKGAWEKVNDIWKSHSYCSLSSAGGAPPLSLPSKVNDKANFYNEVKSWISTIEENPAPINFILTPINTIFSGDKADAVKSALDKYLSRRLFFENRAIKLKSEHQLITLPTILYKGKALTPTDIKYGGVWAFLIDRTTGEIKPGSNKSYPLFKDGVVKNPLNENMKKIYEEVLQPYEGDKSVIACLNFWGIHTNLIDIPREFLSYLKSIGAKDGLKNWVELPTSTAGKYFEQWSIVGHAGLGMGEALESYAASGGYEFGASKLEVLIVPTYDSSKVRFDPI